MSAPTHMCTQKMHTHTHAHRNTQTHTPCGHASFCLPVSYQKKWLKEEVSVEGKGGRGGGERRIYRHWWIKWTHVVFCAAMCLKDSHHCQRGRQAERGGWVGWEGKQPHSKMLCFYGNGDNSVHTITMTTAFNNNQHTHVQLVYFSASQ